MIVLFIFALGMAAGYFLRPAINRGVRKLMDDIRNNRDED
jgi:hypothetical protein